MAVFPYESSRLKTNMRPNQYGQIANHISASLRVELLGV